jgi:hypothetical protein
LEKIFISEKLVFFRAKNATVSTERSGTDYCWLYCAWQVLVDFLRADKKPDFVLWFQNRIKCYENASEIMSTQCVAIVG